MGSICGTNPRIKDCIVSVINNIRIAQLFVDRASLVAELVFEDATLARNVRANNQM